MNVQQRVVGGLVFGLVTLFLVTGCASAKSDVSEASDEAVAGLDFGSTQVATTDLPTASPVPTQLPTKQPTTEPTYVPKQPESISVENQSEKWVDVDLTSLTARAMIGEKTVYSAPVTTGKSGYETPTGDFYVQRRVANETMMSSSGAAEQHYVEDVLFTQYFTDRGHALHLNYWADPQVFGSQNTSHGCVGMRLDDAEYFWNFGDIGTKVSIHH